jgi:hypothetical protein
MRLFLLALKHTATECPMPSRESSRVRTLERGDIYFFYQPKVEEDDPDRYTDLQRLYMVLSPTREARHRLIIIGHKRLPKPERSPENRLWGFVDIVRKSPKKIRAALSAGKYKTQTRGERHMPAARPAGEGVYRVLLHGDHTHLVYALELPDKAGRGARRTRHRARDELHHQHRQSRTQSAASGGTR